MKPPPAIELADVMRAFSGAYVKAYGERMPAVHPKSHPGHYRLPYPGHGR